MSTDLDQRAALEIARASLEELRQWQEGAKVHQLPPPLVDTLHKHCAALHQLFHVLKAEPPEGTAVVRSSGGADAVGTHPPEGVPCVPGELEGATLLSLPHEVMTRLYMLLPVRSCCSLAVAHPQFRDDLNSRADQIFTAHVFTDFGIDQDVVQRTAISARAFYYACATADFSGSWECDVDGAQGTLGYTIQVEHNRRRRHDGEQVEGRGIFPSQGGFPEIPYTLSGTLHRDERMMLRARLTWEGFGESFLQLLVNPMENSLSGPYSQGGAAFDPDAVAGEFRARLSSTLPPAENNDKALLAELELNPAPFRKWHRDAAETRAAVEAGTYEHEWKARELRSASMLVRESCGRCPACGCSDAYGTNIVHGWIGEAPRGATSESETETVHFACGNKLVRRRAAPHRVEWGAVHERAVPFKQVGTDAVCRFVGQSFHVGGAIGQWAERTDP